MPSHSTQNDRLVKDVYDIDEDELYLQVQQGGDYWKSSEKFFLEVKDSFYESLTEKQKKWLHKIETDLNREITK